MNEIITTLIKSGRKLSNRQIDIIMNHLRNAISNKDYELKEKRRVEFEKKFKNETEKLINAFNKSMTILYKKAKKESKEFKINISDAYGDEKGEFIKGAMDNEYGYNEKDKNIQKAYKDADNIVLRLQLGDDVTTSLEEIVESINNIK